MKKIFSILIVVVLGTSLLLTACGPKAPAPAVEPKIPDTIQIFAGRPGDSWTVLTEAMGFFINQDSKWLTAGAVATGGTSDGPKILFEEPAKRDHRLCIFRAQDEPAQYLRETDLEPKFIAAFGLMPMLWVTFDPGIKSLEDFAGKRVGMPRKIPGYYDSFEQALIDAGVIRSAVDIGGFAAQKDSLMDGTIDVAHATFNVIGAEMSPGAHISEMMARKPVYSIDYTKERLERVAKVLDFPQIWLEVPPNSLPNQPKKIYVIAYNYEWYSGAELPDEIAYEIARIAYERASKGHFATYHAMGKAVTADYVWRAVWRTPEEIEKWYHPGALKFYREKGLL